MTDISITPNEFLKKDKEEESHSNNSKSLSY